MPIYEYRCERGHTFEVLQRMSDDPLDVCNTCEARVQRVLNPVAVHFKGSGFYTTDYGRKRSGGGKESSDGAPSDSSKPDSKSDSKSDSGPSPKESKAGSGSD